MFKCDNCGYEWEEFIGYIPTGSPPDTKRCPRCGYPIYLTAKKK